VVGDAEIELDAEGLKAILAKLRAMRAIRRV
jgi:hypothetical protein